MSGARLSLFSTFIDRLVGPPAPARLSWGRSLWMLLAGAAHAAAIAWPFHFLLAQGQPVWWLQILSLTVLALQLDQCRTARQGAWLAWLFATAMQCATWWWLFISLHTYGGLASPLAVIAIVGLAAFLALYHAVAGAAIAGLAPANRGGRVLLFASAWMLAELARVALFTGFPWGESGYAQLDGPFTDLAKVIGVHGLTFGTALLAAGIACVLREPAWRRAAPVLVGALLAAGISWGLRLDQPDVASRFTANSAVAGSAPFSVTLLQGNIAQDEKFEGGSGIPDALAWYGQQLDGASTSLVVTPETAIPVLPAQLPQAYLDSLVDRFVRPPAGRAPSAALVGIPLGSMAEGYSNSVIGLQPPATPLAAGEEPLLYRYDKHHLVPFGEFVHPLFKWFLALVNMPLSDFNSGAVGQLPFVWQGQRLAPNICYEDLFGEELGARFLTASMAPTMFVNISNIGWFGNTIAIDQHLAISRMRAIEFERPMLRATNTGATAIIDHRGVVTAELPRHTRGALTGTVQGRDGLTPYAWWVARFGLWPLWGLGLLVVAAALGNRHRKVNVQPT